MSAPAVVIRIAIEERPLVRYDAMDDGEEARLRDWIERKGYRELVDRAEELVRGEKAA